MKKNKLSLGGDILQTGVSFIPGVGQLLSPLVGLLDQQISAQPNVQKQPLQMNMNPLGKFADGGILNDAFKQYKTGSHTSGKDLTVDGSGNPDPDGSNSVQNNENSYMVNGKQYVFSDVLKKAGKAFNVHAMEINKKYPDARFSRDQRNALDLEMKFLAKENDAARTTESNQKALGGFTNGPDDPVIPPSENIQFMAQNPFQYKVPTNFPTLPTITEQKYGTQGMIEAKQMTGDGTLATDSTTFGTELTPIGKDLSTQTPSKSINITGAKSKFSPGILDAKTANTLGLLTKGFALAGSIGDALSPAEKEKLITPDYTKADKYMQEANIDYTQAKQDAQGVSNIAAQTNRSLSSNAASYQGREMVRLAGLSDQLSRIAEAQNNAQSSLNLTKGQYEAGKATDRANREYQNQQGNMQNQANSRFFDRTLMSDLSQIGSSFNEYGETQKVINNNKELNQFQVNQALAILNSKYPNVKITPDIMEKLKSGASIDEILKISI